jgi:hypothetical protein
MISLHPKALFRSSLYRSQELRLCLFIVACIFAHFWLRWPAFHNPFFHNEDTAGITYSADLLLRGGVPLVDTVEMKSPGAFFILAGGWTLMGRSMESAQLLGVLWSLLAVFGVGWGAWLIYRRALSAGVAMSAYLLLSPFTDSIDINYGAWMITPYIWACVLLFWGLRKVDEGALKGAIWLIFGCGLMVTLSALMKRQGAVLTPLIALTVFLRWSEHRKETIRALMAFGGGVAAGFLPMMIFYLAHGQLSAWIESYFFSESGWRYVEGVMSADQRLDRLGDGLVGLWIHLGTALALALIALLSGRTSKPSIETLLASKGSTPQVDSTASILSASRRILWALLFFSFIGTALGWRFFKGYYLQMLPALLWIASTPRSPFVRLMTREGRSFKVWMSRARQLSPRGRLFQMVTLFPLIATLGVALQNDLTHVAQARARRHRALYTPAVQIKKVSQWVKTNRPRHEAIWVWGRWAWPAYFYTQRPSATRYYKSLGVLTTQLTNTWNPKRPSAPTRFDPRSEWREAIKELRGSPPGVIILAQNEPYSRFKALNQLLKERYAQVSPEELKLVARSRSRASKKTRRRAQSPKFKVYRLR